MHPLMRQHLWQRTLSMNQAGLFLQADDIAIDSLNPAAAAGFLIFMYCECLGGCEWQLLSCSPESIY